MIFNRIPRNVKMPLWTANNEILSLIDANLLHYYKFDDTSNDAVGAVNGTNTNITYAAGKRTNAAVFNGSSSQINFGSTNLLNGAFSLSFWLKPTSIAYSILFQLYCDSTGFLVYFEEANSGIIHFGFRGTDTKIKSSEVLSAGNTYHVTITYNAGSKSSAGSFTYYVNGVSKSLTQDGTVGGSSSTIYFGSLGGFLYYNGWFDEVALFNIALNATQIGALYNSGTGAFLK